MDNDKLQLFENKEIRTAWDEGNETVTNGNALKMTVAAGMSPGLQSRPLKRKRASLLSLPKTRRN